MTNEEEGRMNNRALNLRNYREIAMQLGTWAVAASLTNGIVMMTILGKTSGIDSVAIFAAIILIGGFVLGYLVFLPIQGWRILKRVEKDYGKIVRDKVVEWFVTDAHTKGELDIKKIAVDVGAQSHIR